MQRIVVWPDNGYRISGELQGRIAEYPAAEYPAQRLAPVVRIRASRRRSGSSSGSPIPIKRFRKTNSNVTCESHDTFWNCFDEVANENNSQCRDGFFFHPIANEIDYYLKTVRIDRSRDLYTWWSVNSKHYPYLTKFAKVYLSASCSSVYSERLFSEAGLVYENKRNRLLPANS
ncbi:unnamed protein product [Psylliodes chrysocephalus]|uniref:HAT C-terminal dimerisation domain-containing protein n=1 Tax=Psylliodes chrysocephalus TaxID=3402493 RepID=A0A9P0D539_9CUCU|nr:unnamed protein product [Psylliodes chrysocephala]